MKKSILQFAFWWELRPTKNQPDTGVLHAISTIRQAVSAIADIIENAGYLEDREEELHSTAKRRAFRGLQRIQEENGKEPRLTAKIEFSAALLPEYSKCADSQFGATSEIAESLKIAAEFQMMLFLRPSEGLCPWGNNKAEHYILARDCYLTQGELCIRVTKLATAPAGFNPDCFVAFLKTKKDSTGKNGPKAAAGPFVTRLFNFLKKYPPAKHEMAGIFTGISEPNKLAFRVRDMLAQTAIAVGLDPHRLSLHSFHMAGVSQLLAHGFSSEVIMLCGGWKSFGGLRPYLRNSIAHAKMIAKAMYDTKAVSIAHQRMMYMTQ